MKKADILAALPKLNHADLTAIHAMAGHLLGATGAVAGAAPDEALTVFDALVAALGLSTPYSAIGASKPAIAFKAKVPTLCLFLDTDFKGWDDRKTTQIAFLRMLFGLLTDDLKQRGVKPTINSMIVNMPRLPEVFDAAFPGYRVAGLGGLILSRFQ